jgi:hypothetical protein
MRLVTASRLAALAGFALATNAAFAQQYAAPQITAIVSPAPGVVEITMRFAQGEPRGAAILQVYRKEGRHTSPEGFEVLSRAGYPHRFMDTMGTTEITGDGTTLTLMASGLKSGMFTFYVTRTNGAVFNTIESAPSNVVSVEVSGSYQTDMTIGGSVSSTPATAFAEAIEIVAVGSHPNPATSTLTLTWPAGSGTLRVIDGRGTVVIARELGASDGATLDISGLAPGAYHAEIVQGSRIGRTRFVVAR